MIGEIFPDLRGYGYTNAFSASGVKAAKEAIRAFESAEISEGKVVGKVSA